LNGIVHFDGFLEDEFDFPLEGAVVCLGEYLEAVHETFI